MITERIFYIFVILAEQINLVNYSKLSIKDLSRKEIIVKVIAEVKTHFNETFNRFKSKIHLKHLMVMFLMDYYVFR